MWGLKFDATFQQSTTVDAIRLEGAFAQIDAGEIHAINSNTISVASLVSDNSVATKGVSNSTIFLQEPLKINLPQSPFGGNRVITNRQVAPTVLAATPDLGRLTQWKTATALAPAALPPRAITGLVVNPAINDNVEIGNASFVRITGVPSPYSISGFTSFKKSIGGISNQSGLIKVTVIGHGFVTGVEVSIFGVTGTTSVNNRWTITRVDDDNFTLDGSTYTGPYNTSQAFVGPIPDDGRLLHLWNWTLQALTILNNNNDPAGAATGASGWGLRTYTNRGVGLALAARESAATFIYDRTAYVWILLSMN